jgi:hypothetical protein
MDDTDIESCRKVVSNVERRLGRRLRYQVREDAEQGAVVGWLTEHKRDAGSTFKLRSAKRGVLRFLNSESGLARDRDEQMSGGPDEE